MLRAREIAKFFSGIAVHETLGHWWLGTFGASLLPWKFAWFTFTPEWNYICMALWPIAAVALIYYAWIRTPAPHPTQASRPAAA